MSSHFLYDKICLLGGASYTARFTQALTIPLRCGCFFFQVKILLGQFHPEHFSTKLSGRMVILPPTPGFDWMWSWLLEYNSFNSLQHFSSYLILEGTPNVSSLIVQQAFACFEVPVVKHKTASTAMKKKHSLGSTLNFQAKACNYEEYYYYLGIMISYHTIYMITAWKWIAITYSKRRDKTLINVSPYLTYVSCNNHLYNTICFSVLEFRSKKKYTLWLINIYLVESPTF